jgi:cytochrome c
MNKDKKKVYEKPTLKRERTMNFPVEIINKSSGKKIVCKQCSGCHGCR